MNTSHHSDGSVTGSGQQQEARDGRGLSLAMLSLALLLPRVSRLGDKSDFILGKKYLKHSGQREGAGILQWPERLVLSLMVPPKYQPYELHQLHRPTPKIYVVRPVWLSG